MSRPSSAAVTMAGLFLVAGFPLALLAGMGVYAALIANAVLVAVVVPWTWRITSRYQGLPTTEDRAAEAERVAHMNRRNRKVLSVLFVVCVVAIVLRMAFPH